MDREKLDRIRNRRNDLIAFHSPLVGQQDRDDLLEYVASLEAQLEAALLELDRLGRGSLEA